MLDQNIVREATRLTRAGQLIEATSLLQRMLRGESATKPPGDSAGAKVSLASLGAGLDDRIWVVRKEAGHGR